MPGAGERGLPRLGELGAHVDPERRARRRIFVRPLNRAVMPRHLEGERDRSCRRAAMTACPVSPGAAAPLGSVASPDGVNFSVFSKNATLMELLLFDDGNAARPSRVIPLDPRQHRTYHYWHVFVPGLGPGQTYAYRATGPNAPHRGLRFDREKVLLDPYGLAVAVPDAYDRTAAMRPGDNAAHAMRSVVADPTRYDWEGDTPLERPFAASVIYE